MGGEGGPGPSQSRDAGFAVTPVPQDLLLPQVPPPQEPSYTVPEEFIDPTHPDQFFNVDTKSKLSMSPADIPGNIASLFGIANNPRNAIAFFLHPIDYLNGEYETKVLTSRHPQDYTYTDEAWEKAQQWATFLLVVGSLFLSTYLQGKNVDGSGRLPLLYSRNLETGKLMWGSLPGFVATRLPILVGGASLAAQHRPLMHEGMSSTEAYLAAMNPLVGWNRTFLDRDHAYYDYFYGGNAMGTFVGAFVQQYVMRAANIGAVSVYAQLFPKDIAPFLGQEIGQATAMTAAEVRQAARRAMLGGEALEHLEKARNARMILTAAEEGKIASRGKLARLFYGFGNSWRGGRWKVALTRYLIQAPMLYLQNAVLFYRFLWNKSWKESFISASSVFITLPWNEPWVQGLKTLGVKKIPMFISVLPSSLFVNYVWSVNKWDRDIALKRCQVRASDLLHSTKPEQRSRLRGLIKDSYDMATENERKVWAKPRSEGGCGVIPDPIPDS